MHVSITVKPLITIDENSFLFFKEVKTVQDGIGLFKIDVEYNYFN